MKRRDDYFEKQFRGGRLEGSPDFNRKELNRVRDMSKKIFEDSIFEAKDVKEKNIIFRIYQKFIDLGLF